MNDGWMMAHHSFHTYYVNETSNMRQEMPIEGKSNDCAPDIALPVMNTIINISPPCKIIPIQKDNNNNNTNLITKIYTARLND